MSPSARGASEDGQLTVGCDVSLSGLSFRYYLVFCIEFHQRCVLVSVSIAASCHVILQRGFRLHRLDVFVWYVSWPM